MNTRSPLARHQRDLLQAVADLGVCKDAALACRLSELDEKCDRTTVVKWRSGERSAPLGLLPVLLGFVDDPAAVLEVLARPLGLRVVPEGDLVTDERGLSDRALEIASLSGHVVAAVRDALRDGLVTADERVAIHEAAAQLRRQAAELEALASPSVRVLP